MKSSMKSKFRFSQILTLLIGFSLISLLWLGSGSSYLSTPSSAVLHSLNNTEIVANQNNKNLAFQVDDDESVRKVKKNVNQKEQKKTICLNMIVKNENHVITRCLATVKPIIDYWVIVDTGSTDGTQDTIKEFMKEIPGELHERPWVNFAHNRNLALDLAKGKADYVLIIDADEMLEYSPDFKLPSLNKDSYTLTLIRGNIQYSLPSLCKLSSNWKWNGVLHESITSPLAKTTGHLKGIFRTTKSDGARSQDPEKFLKDAKVLEAALLEEPNNERYMFYLAQSYRDAKLYDKSIEAYKKRAAMGKWDQEVFYSLWQIARIQDWLDMEQEIVTTSYITAFTNRPSRVEPLNDLAKYYLKHEEFEKAYQIASIGKKIPQTTDQLFVEQAAYDYDMDLQYSVAAYWIGKYQECRDICHHLLAKSNLSSSVRSVVEANLDFANKKINESYD